MLRSSAWRVRSIIRFAPNNLRFLSAPSIKSKSFSRRVPDHGVQGLVVDRGPWAGPPPSKRSVARTSICAFLRVIGWGERQYGWPNSDSVCRPSRRPARTLSGRRGMYGYRWDRLLMWFSMMTGRIMPRLAENPLNRVVQIGGTSSVLTM